MTTHNTISEHDRAQLGSPIAKLSGCYIELTLNYPRTTAFKNAKSDKQRSLYLKLLRLIKHALGPNNCIHTEHQFEFCQSGHVHLHALLKYEFTTKHFPIGVVSDIVKTYLKMLPLKYNKYNDNYMFNLWDRYKSPSITCQYQPIENEKRILEWISYIRKEI